MRCPGRVRGSLAAVTVAYLLATAYASSPVHVQLLSAAALGATLAPACGRTPLSLAALAVLLANLAGRGVAGRAVGADTRSSAKITRWDGAAALFGAVAAGYALWSAVAAGTRLRTLGSFLLLAAFFAPLLRALPFMASLDADARALAEEAASRARGVYRSHPIWDRGSDTRAAVEADAQGTLWVSFAGTASRQNAITDARVADLHPAWACDSAKMRVHAGFARAYDSVRDRVLAAVREGVARGSARVVVCGHSLGGALAGLCAYDLGCGGLRAECVTFGAPPAGDALFARACAARSGRLLRLVTPYDPVPPSLGAQFVHAAPPTTLGSSRVGVSAHMMATYQAALGAAAGSRLAGAAVPALWAAGAAVALLRLPPLLRGG